jgi:hypothetical protein
MMGDNFGRWGTTASTLQRTSVGRMRPYSTGMPFPHAALLLIALLSGCASLPKEVYRGYSGPDLPDASLATVELRGAAWVRIDEVHVERQKFAGVKVLPGAHRLEWGRSFGVSFLVDPRMIVEYKHSATVTLDAGRTYRLQADRSYGPGYRVYFWIEDALTGNLVYGTKKP